MATNINVAKHHKDGSFITSLILFRFLQINSVGQLRDRNQLVDLVYQKFSLFSSLLERANVLYNRIDLSPGNSSKRSSSSTLYTVSLSLRVTCFHFLLNYLPATNPSSYQWQRAITIQSLTTASVHKIVHPNLQSWEELELNGDDFTNCSYFPHATSNPNNNTNYHLW